MEKVDKTKWVRLGDYIEVYDRKNTDGKPYPFYGINKDKTFMPTVADTNELDNTKYKVVEKDTFVFNGMHVGRDVAICIALYNADFPVIVSPAYTSFKVIDETIILPEFLFLQLSRDEFGRYGWFFCDASVRGGLDWKRFCDLQIYLPDIEVQREIVAAYNGLKTIAEQNEALLSKISDACHAYIVDCRAKYPAVPLGDYIEQCDERNINNYYNEKNLRGVTNEGAFNSSRANIIGLNFSNYKIVTNGCFAYNPARINIGSIAYNHETTFIVSPMYCVFTIRHEACNILNASYLNLWFRRKEFQRSTLFYATGSVRDIFDYNLMAEVNIPLPPIEVQQSIVALYNCAERARKIATEAREKLKTLCPALVQRAAHC
ncbi:MAG TPA: restriction endonuclease subunit S [Porphyromonadaceae bacterium]|nr:restriction endonuclease subunit S [Porphyromonadaceae bacterium]